MKTITHPVNLSQSTSVEELLDQVGIENRATKTRIIAKLYEMRWLGLDDPEDRAWCRELADMGPDAGLVLSAISKHAADLPAFFAPMSAVCRWKFCEWAIQKPLMTVQLLDEIHRMVQVRPDLYNQWAKQCGWPLV